jgi:hypothetical protein
MRRDDSPAERLVRGARLAWMRHNRRRARGCVRCGARTEAICPACRSRICADCSVISIETGTPIAICLSCSGTSSSTAGQRVLRVRPWELFRSGASLLLLLLLVTAGLALMREGWSGAWRVLLTTLHPSVLLGLVPLALVVGAIVVLIRKAVWKLGR